MERTYHGSVNPEVGYPSTRRQVLSFCEEVMCEVNVGVGDGREDIRALALKSSRRGEGRGGGEGGRWWFELKEGEQDEPAIYAVWFMFNFDRLTRANSNKHRFWRLSRRQTSQKRE